MISERMFDNADTLVLKKTAIPLNKHEANTYYLEIYYLKKK